jgi:hypothetical protein
VNVGQHELKKQAKEDMAEAINALYTNPEVMEEAKKLVTDPNFASYIKEMATDPAFKNYIGAVSIHVTPICSNISNTKTGIHQFSFLRSDAASSQMKEMMEDPATKKRLAQMTDSIKASL